MAKAKIKKSGRAKASGRKPKARVVKAAARKEEGGGHPAPAREAQDREGRRQTGRGQRRTCGKGPGASRRACAP